MTSDLSERKKRQKAIPSFVSENIFFKQNQIIAISVINLDGKQAIKSNKHTTIYSKLRERKRETFACGI